MKTFVMGDVHGAYRALMQCLERASFDYSKDMLIQLGDIVDGYPETAECINELLKIKNLIAIKGNHDDWFDQYLASGIHPDQWKQGGRATALSYLRAIGKEEMVALAGSGYIVALNPADVPERHQLFFRQQALCHIDEDNNLFVHAGFNRHQAFKGQMPEVYFWDRYLWLQALSFEATARNPGNTGVFQMTTSFNEIFIGHTSTTNWKTDQPMHAANIWNLDTGAGHDGKLTIMDIRSKQYWQSDAVSELYKSD